MRKLGRRFFVALFVVLLSTAGVTIQANRAEAQVGVHIGVDIPVFPRLVVVPGYPVYYAPALRANYFFYDGFFWVFNVDDGFWYSSTWYNGPWVAVEPAFVPQPILVIPYRYYRVRPVYWGGWAYDRPPRWDVYWGADWVRRRPAWDRWDRGRRYVTAPLPVFQRQYERDRYPSPAQQVTIYRERYNYRPRDVVVREHETTIIERQSRGGERASARAAFIEQRNQDRAQREANVQQNRQTRENIRERDKAQRQSNIQTERQRQENLRAQREANVQQNRQQREAIQQQDRAQHQAEVQQNRQQRENIREQDKVQRQSNVQQNRQREAVQQQDRAQRQAEIQQNRPHQENLREQRQAQIQQNRQQRENAREPGRAEREANVRERKGAPEKGQAENRG